MSKGLVLIELVALMGLLIALGVAGWYLLNPLELRARENDSLRLADLAILTQAINMSKPLCNGQSDCQGQSNMVIDGYRKSNGDGWVKVDLTAQKSNYLPILPVDPVNTDKFNYSFESDSVGWEINATLESDMHKSKMKNDGGDNDNQYEVGTNLTLIN